jgi:hypothetical protein
MDVCNRRCDEIGCHKQPTPGSKLCAEHQRARAQMCARVRDSLGTKYTVLLPTAMDSGSALSPGDSDSPVQGGDMQTILTQLAEKI